MNILQMGYASVKPAFHETTQVGFFHPFTTTTSTTTTTTTTSTTVTVTLSIGLPLK